VPLYNKQAFVERCLQSILAQTITNFEIVVVDDGSTDQSAAVVSGLGDPRIRLIHQKNTGVAGARNRGIQEAAGPLIALLDADDSWAPEFLEAILDLAAAYPSAGMYATGIRRHFGELAYSDVTWNHSGPGTAVLIENYFVAALEGGFVSSSSVAIPKAVLDRVGGFPLGQALGEDRDLWGRILARYPLAYDTRILAFYFTDPHGRAYHHLRGLVPTPPMVLSLRKILQEEAIPADRAAQIRHYADWCLQEHLFWLGLVGDRQAALELLRNEPLATCENQGEIQLLRIMFRLAPDPVLARLSYLRSVWARLRSLLPGEAPSRPPLLSMRLVK
jgi:glycosyltransferase involved in cell wall biosynthesis